MNQVEMYIIMSESLIEKLKAKKPIFIYQAAEILMVKISDVMALLESGELKKVESAGAVKVDTESLIAYTERLSSQRDSAMNELIDQTQKLGLYK